MDIELGQIFTQIVSFLVMLWVLKRYAWKPLLGILDERKDKIKAEFDSIEEQKNANEKLKNEYSQKLRDIGKQAKAALLQATNEGKQAAQEIVNTARVQAKTILEDGRQEIQHEKQKAKEALKNEVVDLALNAAQKIIKINLDDKKQKELIDQFIEKPELP